MKRLITITFMHIISYYQMIDMDIKEGSKLTIQKVCQAPITHELIYQHVQWQQWVVKAHLNQVEQLLLIHDLVLHKINQLIKKKKKRKKKNITQTCRKWSKTIHYTLKPTTLPSFMNHDLTRGGGVIWARFHWTKRKYYTYFSAGKNK